MASSLQFRYALSPPSPKLPLSHSTSPRFSRTFPLHYYLPGKLRVSSLPRLKGKIHRRKQVFSICCSSKTGSQIERIPVKEDDERPPFDINLAVILAGFAFEAYTTPPENMGRREIDAAGCKTVYLSEEFFREIYDGQLFIKLKKGFNFPAMDPWGTSDPYVVIQMDSQTVKSNTKWGTKEPTWNEEFTFNINRSLSKHLQVNLLIEYDLEENEWLQGLYKIRESWIPIYNRSTFFAGMNTTQRSESINSFFDSFVDATTTLQEFVVKFEKAIESRLEVERREDYESRHKSRILTTGSKLEEHAASIYRRNIFCKFQDELAKINQFTKKKIRREGQRYEYQVSNCFDAQDMFIVDIDLDSKTAKCGCQLFEFMGILCRHILVIFQAKGVVQIPYHFVLQRWTKDANKGIDVSYTKNNFDTQSDTSKIFRRVHAQQEASILVDLAEESEEIYKLIISELGHIHISAMEMKKNLSIDDKVTPLGSSQNNVDEVCLSEQGSKAPQLTIGDPHISQTKGRKKDGDKTTQNCRFKSGLEVSLNKSL